MIYSPLQGRLAQRESAAFTRQRSLVRTQHRPLSKCANLQVKMLGYNVGFGYSSIPRAATRRDPANHTRVSIPFGAVWGRTSYGPWSSQPHAGHSIGRLGSLRMPGEDLQEVGGVGAQIYSRSTRLCSIRLRSSARLWRQRGQAQIILAACVVQTSPGPFGRTWVLSPSPRRTMSRGIVSVRGRRRRMRRWL